MSNFKNLFGIFFLGLALTILNGCAGFNQTDARKFPPNPEARVKKNLEEGRGFRLDSAIKGNMKGGDFLFASSNELWRASLDTIDFMPLSSVNYSGGIIITDWYTEEENIDESVKISIRFLTNEIRSDALDIKVFTKICDALNKCVVNEKSENLIVELKNEILKKAVIYEKENPAKKIVPYKGKIIPKG